MKKIILSLSIFLLSVSGFSQVGNEFWFACPNITSGDYGADNSIKICIVTFDQPSTVTVSQPAMLALGLKGIDTVRILPPNSSWVLDLGVYKSIVEVSDGLPYPFALHITSDNKISAYYANTSEDSEIYTLKGENALGVDFLVPMQFEYSNSTGFNASDAGNSFEILATEDKTEVSVDLLVMTNDPVQKTAIQTIKITLNKGWAYAFKSKSLTGAGHLYNTRIKSNKPIAVNSTDDFVGSGDLVGDQLIPVNLTGVNYIAVRNQGDNEKVYLFPTENKTDVFINGNLLTTMNIGDKRVVSLTAPGMTDATLITSTKPIVVFQITSKSGSLTEFGGAIIPPFSCTGSMETVYKLAFAEITLDIITKTDNIGSFTINDQANIINASDFAPVPGTGIPGWSYCRKKFVSSDAVIKNSGGVIRLKNSKGYFHVGAYDNPTGNSCSYGYFSDFHSIRLQPNVSLDYCYTGGSIQLTLSNADAFSNITWTKPDETKVLSDAINITNATLADAGIYEVMAISKDGCIIPSSAFIVANVFDLKKTSPTICSGDVIHLETDGYRPYTWVPGAGLPDDSIVTVSPKTNTTYTVENYKAGQNIIVNGNFQKENTNFSSEYIFGGTGTNAVASSGQYTVFRNAYEVNSDYNRITDHTSGDATNGRLLIANCNAVAGVKIWTKTVDVKPNTRYIFAAWFISAKIGGVPAQLQYVINDQLEGGLIIPPNSQILTKPEQWKQFSTIWNSGSSNKATVSIITTAGITEGSGVCIDDITFSPLFELSDIFNVKVVKTPNPIITGHTVICQGKSVLDAGGFDNNSPYSSYQWYTTSDTSEIANTRTITVTKPGDYIVKATNQMCSKTDTFSIKPGKELNISLDSVVEVCADESNFNVAYKLQSEELVVYDILFDDKAKATGFVDVKNQLLSGGQFPILLPKNVDSGTYNALLKVVNDSACRDFPLEIHVKIPAKNLMAQKWNDVIALYNENYNGGLHFTAYQWYKNGKIMQGETKSYIYLENNVQLSPTDRYFVRLTTDEGVTFFTCDFIPVIKSLATSLPTMLSPAQFISLDHISISYSGTATFIDINGRICSRQLIDQNTTKIQVPDKKGFYILTIATDDAKPLQFKMFVR